MRMHKLRMRFSGVTALIVALTLAACSGAAPQSEPTVVPTTTPSVALEPAPPDILRWSLDGVTKLPSLDPARPEGVQSNALLSLVFGGLIRLDDKLEIQPDCAAEWSVSADGTVYTFTLREGLVFADGTPVTAGDFVYSITRALQPETASFGAPSQLNHIVGAADVIEGRATELRGVRALDARTLQITLDGPLAFFLAQLSYPYTYVVPRALVESGADWQDRAFGTGPYRVVEHRVGEAVMLEANPYYWQGLPGIPKILMPFSADSETAYQRYRAGALDIMGNRDNPVPAARVNEARALPDFRSAAALTTRYIGFNNRMPPFDNVDVRRALAQAVDKRQAARDVLADSVIPADRILPTGMLGTQIRLQPLAFNPAAAQRSLADAGFPGGAGLPALTLSYAVEGDNEQVVRALQSMWREHLGVEVTLEPLPLDEFIRRLDATYFTPTDGLQFYLSVWGADYPDPQNFLSQQLRSDTRNNNGRFSDADFDRLVAEADRLSDREQIERRLQLYAQAEQIAIDRVGWLPLFYPRFNILMHERVEGMALTPNGIVTPDWSKARLRP